ncbi:unnamed protein product [Heterobilharzia americana]|nr:unnamed protein product [Heterobilharzia americana]
MHIQVSCPINIALLKYWGKSDDLNVYPLTPSISLTLNQAQVGTITTVCISSNLKESHFRLDGEIKQFPSRLLDVLIVAQLRSRLAGKSIQSPFVCVDTENNFPTAAGLASSASGTAAFDDYTHRSSIHQLFPASHWPELKLLICVTSEKTKPVGSTVAMRNCVQTSDLFRSARLPSSKQHEITLIAALKKP